MRSGLRLVIACKHLYSEANIEKVLSGAVHQIERSDSPGIVSFCLDDLLERGKLLVGRRFSDALELLKINNNQFLERHERHFLKYMRSKRILGVPASTSSVADVQRASQRLNTMRDHIFWAYPDADPQDLELVRSLADAMTRKEP